VAGPALDDAQIDDAQEIAWIAGFAARSVLATTRPAAARILSHAFRRDVTSFGYWALGLEKLEIAHRNARPPIAHLPGRVAVVSGGSSTDDLPNDDHLARFLDRGGTTVFAEGKALSAIDANNNGGGSSEKIRLRSPKMPPGPIAVDGRAFKGILPAVFEPLFWIDAETQVPASTKDLEVLVCNPEKSKMPLVARGRKRNGTFIHFATPVAPYGRKAADGSKRITPAEFADGVNIKAEGPLKEENATMPEPLFRATFTMLLVVADLMAQSLALATEPSSSTSLLT
jgi:hypothetical protein